jgi:hypothetical protein
VTRSWIDFGSLLIVFCRFDFHSQEEGAHRPVSLSFWLHHAEAPAYSSFREPSSCPRALGLICPLCFLSDLILGSSAVFFDPIVASAEDPRHSDRPDWSLSTWFCFKCASPDLCFVLAVILSSIFSLAVVAFCLLQVHVSILFLSRQF